jgi:hypothetical protein
LKLLALPTEARQVSDFSHLSGDLGKCGPIEGKGLFGARPKLADPPQTKTAAPTGIGSGGEIIGKLGGSSWDQIYAPAHLAARFPIIARHFGFEVSP